jgi:four helix bundle protein
MGVKSFTELEAWKQSRILHAALCEACKKAPLSKRYRLVAQLKAAGDSTMSNIAEGFERGSMQEFHRSLCIAKGEVGEILSHLHAAHDDQCLDQASFETLSTQAIRVSQLIGALRRSILPWVKQKPK